MSGFLVTGGFLSSRGVTTETVLIDMDAKLGQAGSKLKDLGSKK